MLVVSTPPQSIRRAMDSKRGVSVPGSRIVWCASRAGSSSGYSARACEPRVSWRASAETATRRASGCGSLRERRRGPGRCAPGPRAPRPPCGSRASGASIGSPAYGSGSPGGGLVEPFERRAAAEDEALAERVGREPVGAVQAGAGALADRVEALDAGRPPVEVGDDPAHHVVAGGGDRDALRRRVQPGLLERGDDVREAPRVDHRHVEADRVRAGAPQQVEDRAGDRVARVELVDEALAVVVVERRALAADRLGDQEALAALEADDRGRVELGELEVGEHRAGAGGRAAGRSRTSRAGWSCATRARRRRRWRGSWRGR